MSELSIIHVRTCASNLRWEKQYLSSNGRLVYTVRYGEVWNSPYRYGWSCTCPARVECKHIKLAKTEKCDWNWEAFMGSDAQPNPDNTCPKCGGPTSVIAVGV